MLSKFKSIVGRGSSSPISLQDYTPVTNSPYRWNPRFNEDEVKKCNTRNPRYVVTDSKRDRYAVYTDSLNTCLGVLLFEPSSQGGIAGLAHVMPHASKVKQQEEKIVIDMIEQINSRYSPPELNAVIVIGHDPDPDTLETTAKLMLEFGNISKNRFSLIYGGTGKPYFAGGADTAVSRAAYDTKRKDLNIGTD